MHSPVHQYNIRDIHQRNLISIISAPSILNPHHQHPYPIVDRCSADELNTCIAYFQSSAHSAHFHHYLQQQHHRQRLGHYIEHLIIYWIQYIREHTCHHSIQINAHGKSHGEFDLLFQTSAQWHWWELCFKFYCLHKDGYTLDNWIGPNSKDSLGRKYAHTFSQQLQLSQHPAAQAYLNTIGAVAPAQHAWFKGHLFVHLQQDPQLLAHPALNTEQSLHWFAWSHELEQIPPAQANSSRYLCIDKPEWIAPVMRDPRCQELLGRQQLIKLLRQQFQHSPAPQQRAQMIVEVKPDAEGWWVEVQRGFIMPQHWPDTDPARSQ